MVALYILYVLCGGGIAARDEYEIRIRIDERKKIGDWGHKRVAGSISSVVVVIRA